MLEGDYVYRSDIGGLGKKGVGGLKERSASDAVVLFIFLSFIIAMK